MLYQIDLAGGSPEEIFPQFWVNQESEVDVRAFAERLVRGVTQERGTLDQLIGESSDRWKVERMAATDRNVLRLAVWEMLREPETPAPVAIDEAVEIARRFGNDASGAFVNGVLDAIRKRLGVAGSS